MSTNKQAKKVCVIGAGSSGLTTIKQLLDEGHIPTCYEKTSTLAGIFNYKKETESDLVDGVYDSNVLTISNYMMAFSDMPPSGQRRHWHHKEYKQYLEDYVKKFNLDQYIQFNSQVLKVRMIDGGHNGYEIIVSDAEGNEVVERYDALAVCKGSHQTPSIPNVEGLDDFEGKVLHSAQYKDNKITEGKKVLCVGMGESSADITREISTSAKECILGLKSYPFLLPRNLNNSSSDAWTSRVFHSYYSPKNESFFAYIVLFFYTLFFKWFLVKDKKLDKDSFLQDSSKKMLDLDTPEEVETVKLIKAWNYLSKGKKFYTKNVSFVPYILNGKIKVNASGIEKLTSNSVVFNDGQSHDIDTIMFCTGYRDDFSFIEDFQLKDGNVRNMFMNSIHPDMPNCVFIGWARPITGGVPGCAEMAARYFALLLSGKRALPDDLDERIEKDKAFYEVMLKYSPTYNSVIAWKRYMETYAELIGCQIKTIKYIFQPTLFLKLLAGSLTPYQYRIEGPHALKEEAIKIIKKLEITLPNRSILINAVINLLTKLKIVKMLESVEYSKFYAEWFCFDTKLTLKDLKKYAFRNDDFVSQFKRIE